MERHKFLWADGARRSHRWNDMVLQFVNMSLRVHQKLQSTHNQNYNTARAWIACQAQVFADIRDQPNYIKLTFYVQLAELVTHLWLWCLLRLSMFGKCSWSTEVKFLGRHCQKQNQCRTQTNLECLYKLRNTVFCKQIFPLVEIYTQEVQ